MKSFEDVRCTKTEPDLLTETNSQLNENLLRKGAAVGLFSKSRGHRQTAQRHFSAAAQTLNTNAGASLETKIDDITKSIQELNKGLSELTLQVGALGSISLIAVLLAEKGKRRR